MSEKNEPVRTVSVFAVLVILSGLTLWCVLAPMVEPVPSTLSILGFGLILIGILGLRLGDFRVWVRWLIGVLWCSLGLGVLTLALAGQVPDFPLASWVLVAAWIVLGMSVFIGSRRTFWLAVLWAAASLAGSVLSFLFLDSEQRTSAVVRSLLHAAVLLGLLYSRRTFFEPPARPPAPPNQ
jgi:hypothetical protein